MCVGGVPDDVISGTGDACGGAGDTINSERGVQVPLVTVWVVHFCLPELPELLSECLFSQKAVVWDI